jgi:hypothetical protein
LLKKEVFSMSLRAFQIGIFLCTLLALGSFIGILLKVDPDTGGGLAKGLFFSSLFVVTLGIIMEVMIAVYKKGLGEERAAKHIGGALRQAFLLNLLVLINILLLYRDIWVWWLSLLFFAFILLLEFTARNFHKSEQQ